MFSNKSVFSMEIKIWDNEQEQRFDRFMRKFFRKNQKIKLTDIYSWIRKWFIKVNWRKKQENYKLQLWDIVYINQSEINSSDVLDTFLTKEEKKINVDLSSIKKQILFEDSNWIFWNKPVWLVVHPWNKHTDDLSLNDYLEEYIKQTDKNLLKSDTFKPSFWFRIDKDTSWIIVWAKNYDALKYLNELIRLRKTDKEYLAIVKWKFPKTKTIDEPLFKWFNAKFQRAQTFVNEEKGKEAVTQARVVDVRSVESIWAVSLVAVKILTWRMHQIRVHMAHIWYPIIWDMQYWDEFTNKIAESKFKITRQLLHSSKYSFYDVFKKKEISVQAPLPQDFKKLFW